jgi:hypothetical protein
MKTLTTRVISSKPLKHGNAGDSKLIKHYFDLLVLLKNRILDLFQITALFTVKEK